MTILSLDRPDAIDSFDWSRAAPVVVRNEPDIFEAARQKPREDIDAENKERERKTAEKLAEFKKEILQHTVTTFREGTGHDITAPEKAAFKKRGHFFTAVA